MPSHATGRGVAAISSLGFRVWERNLRLEPDFRRMQVAHTHSDVEVNYVQEGAIRYFFGGRFLEIGAGSLAVFWGGVPHQSVRHGAGLRGIWMTFPLTWLLRWAHAARLGRRIIGGEVVITPADAMDGHLFQRWAREMREPLPAYREVIATEAEARFSRLSFSLPEKEPRRSAAPEGSGRLEAITDFVGARYTEPLSVAEVARAARLHPKSLLRFFREHASLTLWDYVVQLRLSHALRLLITTDQSILEVALASGFGSQSGFYHAFARRFPGLSPSAYRTAHRQLIPESGDAPAAPTARERRATTRQTGARSGASTGL